MEAADIYLDLEQLKSEIIDQNSKKLPEIDRAMKSACSTVATLTTRGWQGEARDAFLERFTEQKKAMRLFYEHVKEFNNQLNTIKADGKKLIAQGNKIVNKL